VKVYISTIRLNFFRSIKVVLLTKLDYYVALLSLYSRISKAGNGDELLFPLVESDVDALNYVSLEDLVSQSLSLTVGAKL